MQWVMMIPYTRELTCFFLLYKWYSALDDGCDAFVAIQTFSIVSILVPVSAYVQWKLSDNYGYELWHGMAWHGRSERGPPFFFATYLGAAGLSFSLVFLGCSPAVCKVKF